MLTRLKCQCPAPAVLGPHAQVRWVALIPGCAWPGTRRALGPQCSWYTARASRGSRALTSQLRQHPRTPCGCRCTSLRATAHHPLLVSGQDCVLLHLLEVTRAPHPQGHGETRELHPLLSWITGQSRELKDRRPHEGQPGTIGWGQPTLGKQLESVRGVPGLLGTSQS